MIKKVLKGFGLVAVLGIGLGLFVYFDNLQIEGDAALKTCWAVDIIDDFTGAKVVGAEDLDFDPESGTIFLSAYDRRAVAREINEGFVTTQGGIYTLKLSDIHQTGVLPVHDISRAYKEAGNEFRPHGIDYSVWEGERKIFAINRLYVLKKGEQYMLPNVEKFELSSDGLIHRRTLKENGLCDLMDVAEMDGFLMSTNSTFFCEYGFREKTFHPDEKTINGGLYPNVTSGNYFPNGLVLWGQNEVAHAATMEKIIIVVYSPLKQGIGAAETIPLPGAPDNLTVDKHEYLYFTTFPNLLDYFFYLKGWFGVSKHPSAAYRMSPNKIHLQERTERGEYSYLESGNEFHKITLLFKDDGIMISGATTALRAGDYLIMGSGWDDNIAICSGMDGLD